MGLFLHSSPAHTCKIKRNSSKSGFTAIELAVVMVMISLAVVSSLPGGNQKYKGPVQGVAQDRETVEVVIDALKRFARVNCRLPCPAIGDLSITDPNYGLEVVDVDCDDGAGTIVINNNTATGVVPVKTLGLPTSLVGRFGKLTYSVDFNSVVDINSSADDVVLITLSGNVPSVVAVVAHEYNGHGAWPVDGGANKINRCVNGALYDASYDENADTPNRATCTQNTGSAGTFQSSRADSTTVSELDVVMGFAEAAVTPCPVP